MTILGVGLIGLSANRGWGGSAHVPALRALPQRFALRAAAGSNPESARLGAERYDVPFATDDPVELAARPDVDLVVIAVKVPEHHRLVCAAIDAGKHVLCEWPLGNGLEEAQDLVARAKAAGVKGFVGLQARSAPPVRFLRDLVASGYVGDILSTTLVADGDMPWGGVSYIGSTYLNDWQTGASMLSIPFGHSIDALCWMLSEFADISGRLAVRRPEVSIAQTGETIRQTSPDQVAVHGVLDSGVIVSAHFRGGLTAGQGFRWEINGTHGDLIVTGPNGHLQYGRIEIRGSQAGQALGNIAVPDSYRTLPVEPGSFAESVAYAYDAIADDIANGTSLAPTFADALERHGLIDRITRSAGAPWAG